MIAAIAGDIIGSVHERAHLKRMNFELFQKNSRFTDDTVLTMAVADCILNGKPYSETIRAYGKKYWARGYGGMFRKWVQDDTMGPYNSFGNGSGMRVSPVGWAFHRLNEVMDEAERSAVCTHNHPEGVKGAQAIAASVFMARKGKSKKEIREYVASTFNYDMNRSAEQIRKHYKFDVTCQGSVPEAIICFLDSRDVEHAIRLAISLGGDADTQACMAGAIAQAFYKKVPQILVDEVQARLEPELWELTQAFCTRYKVAY
ncbi:MAG: ADP-ribosylglycohydrolase family protein [Bacteroidota bacterium]